jgi:hypothetical protein
MSLKKSQYLVLSLTSIDKEIKAPAQSSRQYTDGPFIAGARSFDTGLYTYTTYTRIRWILRLLVQYI